MSNLFLPPPPKELTIWLLWRGMGDLGAEYYFFKREGGVENFEIGCKHWNKWYTSKKECLQEDGDTNNLFAAGAAYK